MDALGEIAVELIVGGIFFLIGFLVYWIFGKTIDWDAVDPENIMFIGMLAVAAIGVFVWILHRIYFDFKGSC